MSDDLRDRGPQDRSRVNVSEEWELRYWSEKFGVSPDAVKSAVAKVGPMVKNVEEHLAEPSRGGKS